ncbi:MAG: cation-translocating P-type ATPase [Desulfobacterales bacterium]|nr:cation-translocating P-type ATPase [Desulfobacterales bacterium]
MTQKLDERGYFAKVSECDLCASVLRPGRFSCVLPGKTFHFCCMGCKQVFTMLFYASDHPDPATFKDSELFEKCRQIGLISNPSRTPGKPLDRENISPGSPGRTRTAAGSDDTNIPEAEPEALLCFNFTVREMWCPSCAWVIEETLKKIPGIESASCNFSTDGARCEYHPVKTSPDKILRAVAALGYPAAGSENELSGETKTVFINFGIAAFLSVNVMMLSFALYSGFFTPFESDTARMISWPIFLMAGGVLFYGGRPIYRKAWAGITVAAYSMETLITVGAFSAYLYSTLNLLSGSIHLYFDTSCMLITLVLLGKVLERKAKDKIQQNLKTFFSLRPSKVRICSASAPQGRYAAADQLKIGDVFQAEENEIIAADGLILTGQGSVDESSITGEPLPVKKNPGDKVQSGTSVFQGAFQIRAEAVGESSTVNQMIRIMETALRGKTPLEGKTEKLLKWFVPVIFILAAGAGWAGFFSGLAAGQAMARALSVMVVSCPCALGIAIPLARVAGVARAARMGILVRDFSAFEKTARVKKILFDKTGTLTGGHWALVDIVPLFLSKEKVLALAACLENASDHHIALEIKRAAQKAQALPIKMKKIQRFENGISGRLGKDQVKIGSQEFLARELENSPPAGLAAPVRENPRHAFVFMSYNHRICAIFIFGDTIKEHSAQTVERLVQMGYGTALVSGDNAQTTRAVGRKLGIDAAFGGLLPLEKARLVENFQQQGFQTAMVGDGINDAPALARADLAVAVHAGSHLGKEVADITLMGGNPMQLIDFLDLARYVNKKIRQNLAFSFLYNLISIPMAMAGLLSPLIAVSAMLLSSLSVTGNTLLMVKKNIPPNGRRSP